jgi:hypothetical protein
MGMEHVMRVGHEVCCNHLSLSQSMAVVRRWCPAEQHWVLWRVLACELQELQALDRAVLQAQTVTTSGASGRHGLQQDSSPQFSGHGEWTNSDGHEVSSHPAPPPPPAAAGQHAAAPKPMGTPWTVHNAALPAYPAQTTPQLPFTHHSCHS